MSNSIDQISKTTAYAAAQLHEDGKLQLPPEFRLDGAKDFFVWRDGKDLIISKNPPPVTLDELFSEIKDSPESIAWRNTMDELFPVFINKKTKTKTIKI